MKKYDIVIKNGNIVNENSIEAGDIGIKHGKIIDIRHQIDDFQDSEKIIDAQNLYVLPGLVDVHVHFNEPGRTGWEGLATGSRSSAAGGVTTFFDMPLNSDPPLIYPELFEVKKQLAEEKSIVDFGILGGIVPENLEHLEELKKCGVIGFKGFMSNSGIKEFNFIDDASLFKGLRKISSIDSILMLHAESETITSELTAEALKEGLCSARDYVNSRPVISEIEAVDRAVNMAEAAGCRVHIVHASCRDVVKRVMLAKEKGVDVTVETCPHYLALTVEDIERLGAVAKCSPPVRNMQEVEGLWEAIRNDEIDIVSSDHSPSSSEFKDMTGGKSIFNVWGGIASAQSTLNILLEEGYWNRGITLNQIVKLTSANPARRFGIYPQKGTISIGSDGDLALVDLNQCFTLKKEDLMYRHKMSPFIGKSFRGKLVYTIARGNIVYEKGEIVESSHRGKLIK